MNTTGFSTPATLVAATCLVLPYADAVMPFGNMSLSRNVPEQPCRAAMKRAAASH